MSSNVVELFPSCAFCEDFYQLTGTYPCECNHSQEYTAADLIDAQFAEFGVDSIVLSRQQWQQVKGERV